MNGSRDVLYVRTSPGTAAKASIVAVSARTGETLRQLNDGAIAPDGRSVYWTEPAAGATKTVLHVTDLATGSDLRTFTIDGDLHPAGLAGTFDPAAYDGRLTPDGRFLALMSSPYQLNGGWITRAAVVDTSDGALAGPVELPAQNTYGFLTISSDGKALFLEQYGGGETRTRVLDVATATLHDLGGPGIVQEGFRAAAIRSADHSRVFRVDSGRQTTNCTSSDGPACVPNGTAPSVIALDLVTRRSTQVMLPSSQMSSDFEKYMLWSLVLSADGGALYATNPALGVVDEVDAKTLTLRRTASIPVSRADGGLLTALGRVLFPVAEAKRYLLGGAALSPDGRTLFAAAHDGIAVIDTRSLGAQALWQTAHQFDALRISRDGAYLYGIDNGKGIIVLIDPTSGADVGEIKLQYMAGIVGIDVGR